MMFRQTPDAWIGIPQPSHAWLSGQIIRAWGNAEFGDVEPYEEVCLAAEQHDVGWLAWEQAPTLDKRTGRPHGFRDLGIMAHTGIWRQGTAMAGVFGRYVALLVSLHGTGLYAAFEGSAGDAAIVREFVSAQHAIQRRLMDGLRADPAMAGFAGNETIERNRRLARTADRMSIAICTGMGDMAVRSGEPRVGIVRQVPTAAGETDLRLEAIGGDLTRIAVHPWPFAAPSVPVTCEGIVLPADPFTDEAAMRRALSDAARVTIAAELTPG